MQSPRRSARKQASALGISNHSVRRILHQDLHFHPYKVVVVQELIQQDWINRVETRQHLIERLPDAVVFFSDEVHFHISGCVNKQNMRYWSGANPSEIHQRPLHSDRFTVWCAISRIGIIGPYFFDEDDRAVAVNSERYVTMIQEFFAPVLRN